MTVLPVKTSGEKRRYPRVSLGVTLAIDVKGQPAGKCRGAISDLSEGGMSLRTSAELEKGMCVHMMVNKMQIRGEVRNIGAEKGGMRRYGVRFHKISNSQSDNQENQP
jgi:c-di-GMP-binding flagellar brake protein YcgR